MRIISGAKELEEELYYLVRPARVTWLRRDRNAVLEAAAKDVQGRGMKEAATVIRRRKEKP